MRIKIKSIIILLILIFAGAYVLIPIIKTRFKKTAKIDFSSSIDTSGSSFLPSNSNYYFFDFEKIDNKDIIYEKTAHSGKRSLKLFGEGYSYGMEINANQVDLSNARHFSLSSWIFIKDKSSKPDFTLVFSIEENKKSIFWYGNTVAGENLESEKWFKISSTGVLDSMVKLNNNCIFKIYLWNKSKCNILMDDVAVVIGQEFKKGNYLSETPIDPYSYIPKFNLPPFRSLFFKAIDIGNNNDKYLVNHDGQKHGEFKFDDKVFIGNFLKYRNNSQSILLANPSGDLNIYYFCETEKRFSKSTIKNSIIPKQSINSNELLIGDFNADFVDELLFIDKAKKQLVLLKINNPKQLCPKDESETIEFSKISQFSTNQITGLNINESNKYISADIDGDNSSELIKIDQNGSYFVYKYTLKGWQSVNLEAKNIPEWNSSKNELQIVKGKFLKKFNKDVLLSVYSTKKSKTNNYTIFFFNEKTKVFESFYTINKAPKGKIIGLDTLKTSDTFIVGNYDNDKEDELLRYNRDWRFNLKEIKFNDSTFAIQSNIDFTGFKKSQNPKYYEDLTIFSGNFFNKNFSSLLTIKRNKKNVVNFLPNSIEIYSPNISK
ncbi:MAG: hypothetical protein HXX09_07675 [Bacteroidetes bacterium]|nr:hypothetical protein [Bacteroidota bacterium]